MKTLTELESYELNSLPADAIVLTVERNGGGGNIYGPFQNRDEALEAKPLIAEHLQDESYIRTVAEAIEIFC